MLGVSAKAWWSNPNPDPHLDEGAGAEALPLSGRSEQGATTGRRWGGLGG